MDGVAPREPIDLTNATPDTIVDVLEKEVRLGDGVQKAGLCVGVETLDAIVTRNLG
jgi:hypothetical protein